jgi:PAS domain S-box-containing protein
MVNTMPTSYILWDENGKLTDCNQETLSLFGLSNKEAFLQNFLTLSPEFQPNGRRSAEVIPQILENAFVSGHIKFKWMHVTADGEPFPAEITASRIPKGDGYILAAYIRNLRNQEAVKIYTDAKTKFLASISHEIRTPLNAIQAMAQIAAEINNLDEGKQSLIDQGMRSVKLLSSAIETILDFSKLDSGRLSLESGEFSVRKLVEGICGIVRKDAGEKSLYLNASVASDVPESLTGDAARLQQALFNIVINAVKFTETGGITIHVYREKDDRDDKVPLVFEVKDTGIGISEKQMSNMFKPLTSGDSSYSRKYGGMGMGLAVSNGLAALMGGKITCESRPGEGSIFTIRLSLSVPGEKAKAEDTNVSVTEALRGMRVLVAEDNKVNQMIINTLLSAAGINVTVTNNGIEALDTLRKASFDLVLMDIQMPEMDGLTATAQIRSDPRYADLPIVALTANVGAEYEAECIKAGMNGYLTKPVDMEKLYGALVKWRR